MLPPDGLHSSFRRASRGSERAVWDAATRAGTVAPTPLATAQVPGGTSIGTRRRAAARARSPERVGSRRDLRAAESRRVGSRASYRSLRSHRGESGTTVPSSAALSEPTHAAARSSGEVGALHVAGTEHHTAKYMPLRILSRRMQVATVLTRARGEEGGGQPSRAPGGRRSLARSPAPPRPTTRPPVDRRQSSRRGEPRSRSPRVREASAEDPLSGEGRRPLSLVSRARGSEHVIGAGTRLFGASPSGSDGGEEERRPARPRGRSAARQPRGRRARYTSRAGDDRAICRARPRALRRPRARAPAAARRF